MRISTGTPEDHPTPLPLDATGLPAVAPPTPRFPYGTGRGGVLKDTSGVDFTADAAAAMHAGMAADADRRGRYAAAAGPLGASAGDALDLPVYGTDGTVAGHWFDPPRSGTPADTG